MNQVRDKIEKNRDNPEYLEKLYQEDKKAFIEAFESVYTNHANELLLRFWNTRLFNKKEPVNSKGLILRYSILLLLIISTWIPVRLLTIESFTNKDLLIKIIPILFSFSLSVYFSLDTFKIKIFLVALLLHVVLLMYLLFIPTIGISQSIANALYFSAILLWFFIGISYTSLNLQDRKSMADFIQKTGETFIWSTLFVLGGAVLMALSINLFETIGIDAENFYISNIATFGLCSAPFIALIVLKKIDKIKISTILANIFLPLFLVSIITFAIVSLFTEIKPYEARDVFIIYNIMLALVICLLAFVNINTQNSKFIQVCSTVLTILTVVLDGIVLSAIIYRIKNYGVTPNKVTLLLTNIVMMGNLFFYIYLRLKNRGKKYYFEQSISYLIAYPVLAIIVVFILPFIFKFK